MTSTSGLSSGVGRHTSTSGLPRLVSRQTSTSGLIESLKAVRGKKADDKTEQEQLSDDENSDDAMEVDLFPK